MKPDAHLVSAIRFALHLEDCALSATARRAYAVALRAVARELDPCAPLEGTEGLGGLLTIALQDLLLQVQAELAARPEAAGGSP